MLTPVIENIIVKYLNKEASATELDTLDQWLENDSHLKIFESYVKTSHLVDANLVKFDTETAKEKLLALIAEEKKVINMKPLFRVARYAAVLMVLMGVAFLFKDQLFLKNDQSVENDIKVVENTIEVGTDKATLTLEDGSKITLQKGTSYETLYAESDGEALVYQSEEEQPTEVVYNVLTIPRGGQFFVQLSDGTKVWLNSESELKYPKGFIAGKPRKVELVYGEAYFEVASSTLHKGAGFKVISENQEIEVLGTQFNIRAYQDEQITYTTLVEGKVMVNKGNDNQILNPGQQSITSADSKIIVKQADVKLETAWRQGLFSFKDKSLKKIMKVLSRWYDVDITFENEALENIRFKGVLSKDQSLEDILLTIKKLKVIKDFEIHKNQVLIK